MAKHRKQRGQTMVELSAAIAAGLLITAFSVQAGVARLRAQRLEVAIENVRYIAQVADDNRVSVENGLENVDTTYTYTFRDQNPWITTAQFNTAWGTTLPTTTPWGTNYEVRAAGNTIAQARFTTPVNPRVQPQNSTLAILPGPNYQVTVWAEQRLFGRSKRVRNYREVLQLETPRW